MLDENLTWKNHTNKIEKKVSKGIRLLYKTNFSLKRKCLKDIYLRYLRYLLTFIHSYISANICCRASTNPNKLKKLHNEQKHAARIIINKYRLIHSRPLMKELNILNISIEHQSNTQFYV